LRAFSSGSTALTGVEAIADGVQAFRRPQAKNAAATLAIMGGMAVSMFLGITLLAQLLQVRITEEIASTNSVLSQIGRTVFGGGPLFFALQVFTAAILVLAANTAFQDFPRLSSILARDRFMPSQFRNRGDRLVFSNGVLILAALACLLIWFYDANLTRLIQLYVVGVFTAFTLSQAGMVRRWFTLKGDGWRRSALINGIGAVTTGVVLVIVTITKFDKGAKVVVAAIPVIVLFFWSVHTHYERVGRLLRSGHLSGKAEAHNGFVLLVRALDAATMDAIGYLRAVRPERLVPIFVGDDDDYGDTSVGWTSCAPRLGKLEPLANAERHPVRAIRQVARSLRRSSDEFVTVVIPERVGKGLLGQVLGRSSAFALKTALLFEPGVVVTDVPLVPGEAESTGERPLEPTRHVVLVPVSAVHDATVRAVVYGKALHPTHIEALYMAMDIEESAGMVRAWHDRQMDVPLVMVEAPFRDIGEPLLHEVRRHTDHPGTVVTVVLPELIPRHWWEAVLHNQTGLYLKRLLLFEPGVVLTSVPFHLRDPEVSDEVPEDLASDPAGGRTEP
jgi:amino acid permease-like protein